MTSDILGDLMALRKKALAEKRRYTALVLKDAIREIKILNMYVEVLDKRIAKYEGQGK